jgi:sugar-specific transcriptional regulator TrmB
MGAETMSALRGMGLTEYEAKAYVALASLISSGAGQVSLFGQIPRSRVYEVLRNLVAKGYIETSHGRPRAFTVVPPREVFEKARKDISARMDRAEAEIETVYETQAPKVAAPIWLIHGADKIINKEIEVIGRAKRTLYFLGGFVLPGELETLRPWFEKAIRRGVRMRVIARPSYILEGRRVRAANQWKGLDCEMQTIQKMPNIKAVMRDDSEMVMGFCRSPEEGGEPQSVMGIWHQYPEFAGAITAVYDSLWVQGRQKKAPIYSAKRVSPEK